MTINNFLITGDTHGRTIERLNYIRKNMPEYIPEETAVIILGDAAFNFRLNAKDKEMKKLCNDTGYIIYCVRGNHEQRPELIDTITKIYDVNVGNYVYYEPDFPFIRYFCDGYIYNLGGKYKTLVIGGAYSVDKNYRLANGMTWFDKEMLDEKERKDILNQVAGENVDFIFTHTCPYSWEPHDLFLPMIDQKSVDKSMEKWLDIVNIMVNWNIYCFGHFHADRIERPFVEQYYYDVENLDDVYNYWIQDFGKERPMRLRIKSPNYIEQEKCYDWFTDYRDIDSLD